MSVPVANGGTIDAADINAPFDYLKNNSLATVNLGAVCVDDSSADLAFKTSSLPGDASVVGVVISTSIAAGASGYLAGQGIFTVLTTGVVTRGHWLINSSTPGYAKDSGSIQRPTVGAIGEAKTGSAGGLSSVKAKLSIVPFTSSTILQILTSVFTPTRFTASPGTFGFTVDSGADLVAVLLTGRTAASYASLFSTVTINGAGMTIVQNTGTVYQHAAIAYLRNPTPGANSIVVTCGTAPQEVIAMPLDMIGSLASPVRNSVGSTNTSDALPVVANDIALECIRNDGALSVSDGQTLVASNLVAYYNYFAIKAILASGTDTFSWAGSGSNVAHAVAVISGS